MNKITYILFLMLLSMFFSCSSDELEVKDYLAYVKNPDNGLKVSKDLNEYQFELQYKPVEFIAINEQRTIHVDTAIYKQRVEELNGLQYYTLKIQALAGKEMMRTGITSEQEYSNRLQYFSDIAQYDMRLIDGNDTLTCVLFHFERNYGVAPYNNIVLGFPKTAGEVEDRTFTFSEQVLGVGKVNLKVAKQDINNIPKVKLN